MASGTHDRMVSDLVPVYMDHATLAICPDAWPKAYDQLHITPQIDGLIAAHYKGKPVARFLPTDEAIINKLYDSMFTATAGGQLNSSPDDDPIRTSCQNWDPANFPFGGHYHALPAVPIELRGAKTVGVVMPDVFQEWFRSGGTHPTEIVQGKYTIRQYTVCFSGVVRAPDTDYKGEMMQFVSPHGSVQRYNTWKNVR